MPRHHHRPQLVEKKSPPKESRHDRFRRLIKPRMKELQAAARKIGTLATNRTDYEFTEREADQIIRRAYELADEIKVRYKASGGKGRDDFFFEEELEEEEEE